MPSLPFGVGSGNKDLSLRVLHYNRRDVPLPVTALGLGDRDWKTRILFVVLNVSSQCDRLDSWR